MLRIGWVTSWTFAWQIPIGRTTTDSYDGDAYPTDELRVTPVSYIVRLVGTNIPDTRQLSGARYNSEAVMLGVSVEGHRNRPLSLSKLKLHQISNDLPGATILTFVPGLFSETSFSNSLGSAFIAGNVS